jgi:hypothetical protein
MSIFLLHMIYRQIYRQFMHTYSFFSLFREIHVAHMYTKYGRSPPPYIKRSSRPTLDRDSLIRWTTFRKWYLFQSSGKVVPAHLGPSMQVAICICLSGTDVCCYRSPSLSLLYFLKRVGYCTLQVGIGRWL